MKDFILTEKIVSATGNKNLSSNLYMDINKKQPFSTQFIGEEPSTKVVIMMVDKGPSGFVTRINSKIPSKGLLFTLSEIHDSDAAPNEAVLLVHEDVNFSKLINYLGIMRKAGYINPRIFFFSRNKDWMAEIAKSGAMPLSVDKIKKETKVNKKDE
jgi:hypothetical protein